MCNFFLSVLKSNTTVRSPPANLRLNQNAKGDSKIIEELNLQVTKSYLIQMCCFCTVFLYFIESYLIYLTIICIPVGTGTKSNIGGSGERERFLLWQAEGS